MKTILCLVLVLLNLSAVAGQRRVKSVAVAVPAASYAIWNVNSEQAISEQNSDRIRSIASITKLMTVLVTLQSGASLEEYVTVTGTESSKRIRPGMKMTRHELIELALVSSDNLAARTLSETSEMSYSEFIIKMNTVARYLGMADTHYADSTGLVSANVSTLADIKRLIAITEQYPIYRESANSKQTLITVRVKNKIKQITANNTNSFAGTLDIIGAKTGFTNSAGRCLTMLFRKDGAEYILVILGASTPEQRRQTVNKLISTIK